MKGFKITNSNIYISYPINICDITFKLLFRDTLLAYTFKTQLSDYDGIAAFLLKLHCFKTIQSCLGFHT